MPNISINFMRCSSITLVLLIVLALTACGKPRIEPTIGPIYGGSGRSSLEDRGPELYVDGDAKDVGKIDPVVDAALIKKCVDAAALREVVDKIISYLPLDGTSHAPA